MKIQPDHYGLLIKYLKNYNLVNDGTRKTMFLDLKITLIYNKNIL